MKHFMDCNSNIRYDGISDYCASEELILRQLEESTKSGLVPNRELGIYTRDGYGALVGYCPDNCISLEDVVNYTYQDFGRETVGKPTIKEKIKEVVNRDGIPADSYFGYKSLIADGYELIIGPGCDVNGEHWNKAIYCRNYEEILNRDNNKDTEKNKSITVVVPGDVLDSLSEDEKDAIGKDYYTFRPTENIQEEVEGLIALPVSEDNLPEDYVIKVDLDKLPELLIMKLQEAIVTYPKNEKGFYEDIFGLYNKSGNIKR